MNWSELNNEELKKLKDCILKDWKFILDLDKCTIRSTSIEFLSGYKLVEVLLLPQTLEYEDSVNTIIKTPCLLILLFKAENSIDEDQIIFFDSHPDTVYEVNKKIGLSLTENSVVEYLEYWGYVSRDNHHPMIFVKDLNSVEMTSDVNVEDKNKLLGALNASYPIDKEGRFKITLTPNKSIYGNFIELSMPHIFQYKVYSSTLKVNYEGYVDIVESKSLLEKDILEDYKVYPVFNIKERKIEYGLKNKENKIQSKSNKKIVAFLLFTSPVYWSVAFLVIALFVDLFLLVISDQFRSSILNDFLLNNNVIVFLSTLGAMIVLMFFLVAMIAFIYSSFIKDKSPSAFNQIQRTVKNIANNNRKSRFKLISQQVKSIVEITTILIVVWTIFIYGLDNFFGIELKQNLSLELGECFIFTFQAISTKLLSDVYNLIGLPNSGFYDNLTIQGKVIINIFRIYMFSIFIRFGKSWWDANHPDPKNIILSN